MMVSLTKKSILVTGGDGNIGREVIRQLSLEKRGDLRIVGGVRSISKSKNRDKGLEHHELVEMDYDIPETVAAALKGIDKLFLLTPTHPKMVDFTSNLVNGAKGAQVKHIVKLSHIRADAANESQINITRMHRQAEKVIEESVSHLPSCVQTSLCRTLSIFILVKTKVQSISLQEMVRSVL
jgi:uncharacterized protein YbjT (DUF2867 family)